MAVVLWQLFEYYYYYMYLTLECVLSSSTKLFVIVCVVGAEREALSSPLPLPQDEEYVRQLQSELDTIFDVQDIGRPLREDIQPSVTVSHVKLDLEIHGTVSPLRNGHLQLLNLSLTSFMCPWVIVIISLLQDDGQQLEEETPQGLKVKIAEHIVSTCHNV